ncbi:MAG: hypothetical protein JWP01_3235 [Myxococcales bacterium]|nr:hypothetical protein [Myxococcales bacterium]
MKRFKKSGLPAVAAMLIASQLYAQPVVPATPPTDPAAPAPQGQLSADEMKVRSQALTAQVRTDIQRVQHLQTLARQQKDIIKLSCVNDKFVKLKAETNIFDNTQAELTASIDTDARFAVFPRLEKAGVDTHKVREEAEACVGEGEIVPGNSDATVTSPEIEDDPTSGVPFGAVEVEPPAYASPFN